MVVLNKYNLHTEKYNSISLLENKFRIKKESVNIPFFFKNYLYSNINSSEFSTTPLVMFYLKKTKYLKYIVLANLIYRSARRYVFYIQTMNKLIRFLNVWYRDKVYHEFHLFSRLIESNVNNIEVSYLYYKLKYITTAYKKINFIYTKYISYRYVNTVQSIKELLDRELSTGMVSNKQYKRNTSSLLFKFKNSLFKCFESVSVDHNLIKLFSDIKNIPVAMLKKKFTPTVFKNEKHYLFSNEHKNSIKEIFNVFLMDYYNISYKDLVNYIILYKINNWKDIFSFLNSRLDTVLYHSGYVDSLKEVQELIKADRLKINGLSVNSESVFVFPGGVVELSLKKAMPLDHLFISFYLLCRSLQNNLFLYKNLCLVFFTNLAKMNLLNIEKNHYSILTYNESNNTNGLLNRIVLLHSVLYPVMGNINAVVVLSTNKIYSLSNLIYSKVKDRLCLFNRITYFFNVYSKEEILIKRYSNKKKINIYHNKLLQYVNKKYGILFNSFLVNDSISYWIADYNKYTLFDTYSYIVKINQLNYKYTIIKYINGSLNNSEITLFNRYMLFRTLVNKMRISINQVNTNSLASESVYFIMPLLLNSIDFSLLYNYGLDTLPKINRNFMDA